MTYLALMIISLVLGFATQAYINSSYRKYSKYSNGTGLTGAQIARRMLDDNGMQDVPVQRVAGSLSDHFDPRGPVVRLSEGVYDSSSISAMAIACHECGHAVQYARGYAPMKFRTALVPIANFGSSVWFWLLMFGLMLNITGLTWAGIILFAFAVLFHLVTLPVEFNASSRAMTYMNTIGLPQAEQGGAYAVLRACALTYVAAALTSILQLLWLLGQQRD